MTNEAIEGNEWAAYDALDTYSQDETRDRLTRREANGDGASIVIRERESRSHGEGRQVIRS